MPENPVTDAVKQLVEGALAPAAAVTVNNQSPNDLEGVKLFAKVQRYGHRLEESLVAGNQADEKIQAAAKAAKDLSDYYIVLPDKINTLMKLDHPTSRGNESQITIAHQIARAGGNEALAAHIETELQGRSSHLQGRLTPKQLEEMGVVEDFGNPALYQITVVNKETGKKGSINVDLKNFDEVGMALESIDRTGRGQNIMSQSEFTQLQDAKALDAVRRQGAVPAR